MIEQGAKLFDELIVAIGDNPNKTCTFTSDDRMDMLSRSIKDTVRLDRYHNRFLIDYAIEMDAQFILRGVRNEKDLSYEQSMAHFNSKNNPEILTVVLVCPPKLSMLSSSFVKGLVGPEHWERRVQMMVPHGVFERLKLLP